MPPLRRFNIYHIWRPLSYFWYPSVYPDALIFVNLVLWLQLTGTETVAQKIGRFWVLWKSLWEIQIWKLPTPKFKMNSPQKYAILEAIWVFPKIVGFPPKSSHFNRVFHDFHHPFWGFSPYSWKHPYITDFYYLPFCCWVSRNFFAWLRGFAPQAPRHGSRPAALEAIIATWHEDSLIQHS